LFAADRYWIAFSGYNNEHAPGAAKNLMSIDAVGNILVPARQVIPERRPPEYVGRGVAISNNGNLLNLWFPGLEYQDGQFDHSLFRAAIQKRTLKASAIHKTPIRVVNEKFLGVTQKPSNNFLAVQIIEQPVSKDVERYIGYSLSEHGAVLPEAPWTLSPDPATCAIRSAPYDCNMNVSSNGGVLLIRGVNPSKQLESKIVLQRLGKTGRPLAKQVVSAKGRGLFPLDISNILPGNKRFLLYWHGYLFLQPVDANTLANLGERIRLNYTYSIIAAIDPQGRFVIYAKLPGLFFQALDAVGHPSGPPKVLSGNVGQGNIDILKD
jgi:hypothetical protein